MSRVSSKGQITPFKIKYNKYLHSTVLLKNDKGVRSNVEVKTTRGNRDLAEVTEVLVVKMEGTVKPRKFKTKCQPEVTDLIWELENFKGMVRAEALVNRARVEFDCGTSIGLPSRWCFFLGLQTTDVYGDFSLCSCDYLSRPVDNRGNGNRLVMYLKPECPEVIKHNLFAGFDIVIKRSNGTSYHDDKTDVGNYIRCSEEGKIDYNFYPHSHIGSLNALLDPESGPLVNGCITVYLRFVLFTSDPFPVDEIRSPATSILLNEQGGKAVLEDVAALLDSEENADIIIETKDKGILKAHKVILAARSPVFFAMFQTKMKEASSGVVDINDVSYRTMSIILKFIYSGTLKMDWDDMDLIEEVSYAAEKYSLDQLKVFLDQVLGSTCKTENALRILKISRLYCLRTCEEDALKFIEKNLRNIL